MAKNPTSFFDPFKAENPLLAMMTIGLHSTNYFSEVWLGAIRGMMSNTVEEQPCDQKVVRSDKVVQRSRTQSDDLKKISGVGPKLEMMLKKKGVETYAQIVALSDKEIKSLDQTLGLSGRIRRDDWVRQAEALIEG